MAARVTTTPAPRAIEPLAVSVDEAVKVSGLSRSALYGYIRGGQLVAKKAGRRTLIPMASLRALIAGFADA